jgi:hypothetical protein
MSISTLEQAVVGRRVEFAYYSNLQSDSKTVWHPGIITATEPGLTGVTLAVIRLDGERRSGLHIPVDYEGLRYLAQVVDVPELPMGRFQPTKSMPGFEEFEGVLVVILGDDRLVMVTADPVKAVTAANERLLDMGAYGDATTEQLRSGWAVFEWQPEDAEHDWFMDFSAEEGDDHAVRIHYLPA